MAETTSVNSQVSDADTQEDVQSLGSAPSLSTGNLMLATTQALSNAAHNATTAQQQSGVTILASTTTGVANLFGIDTGATGESEKDI